ncbi:MAG: methylenetetrahydrofolate reductase [NAD(P)H] [Micavibrio sp.]|nr:methylenetetrahydrofolate reductase [NAD(P)H] [Micavibrio sp.]
MTKPTISFEYFPPKSEKAETALWDAMDKLAMLDPAYMTVTYGAGGSTRDGTLATLKKARDRFGIPLASHLTFINTTKDDMYALVDELWDENIKHIVALRGDMPGDLQWPLENDENYFQYTSDFVAGLVARHPFEISVGCYPEKHPDAPSMDDDLRALKLKCDAGATRAITQFFFDNDLFYRFRDQCEKIGIETPIVPGLLPIHDFKSMCNFAGKCQASVPDWLHGRFEDVSDEDAHKIALDLLVGQSEDLAANGVEHIHYYTLNKADMTTEACVALGYKAKAAA